MAIARAAKPVAAGRPDQTVAIARAAKPPRRVAPIRPGVFATAVRPAILAASRSDWLRRTAERMPVTRKVVHRFVPGETMGSVLESIVALRDSSRYVSVNYLGEDVADADDAAATTQTYLCLLDALGGGPMSLATVCGRSRCR
ncbi:hypothetical protein MYXE_15040 [Mycobacterium xenopi]|uniref:Uncharacterized protein n=1 Tax=Mycobacterium xenopi TaxID=1789 RepID=A0AAD1M0S8_MYCXE|nr:hypothetical protein MYXE_15040 [Mycobacterium xenopi]